MVIEKRARKLPDLPGMVAALEGRQGMAACVAAMAEATPGGG
jgi:hypothetical protein